MWSSASRSGKIVIHTFLQLSFYKFHFISVSSAPNARPCVFVAACLSRQFPNHFAISGGSWFQRQTPWRQSAHLAFMWNSHLPAVCPAYSFAHALNGMGVPGSQNKRIFNVVSRPVPEPERCTAKSSRRNRRRCPGSGPILVSPQLRAPVLKTNASPVPNWWPPQTQTITSPGFSTRFSCHATPKKSQECPP